MMDSGGDRVEEGRRGWSGVSGGPLVRLLQVSIQQDNSSTHRDNLLTVRSSSLLGETISGHKTRTDCVLGKAVTVVS